MFDLIRNLAHGWTGKLILILITVTFALFGIESYLTSAGSNIGVAEVDGQTIPVQSYDNAIKNMRARLQSQGLDPNELDNPQMKALVLNNLIDQRIVQKAVQEENFAISDAHLTTYITGMPEFQKEGKFSQERYDLLLSQNQLTPSKFEAGTRSDLLVQQAQDGIAKLGLMTKERQSAVLKLMNQKRTVSVAEVQTKDYLDQVKVEENDIKAYYDKNKDKLLVPEKVKLEFLVMSANSMITQVEVNDDEVKAYYEENITQYQGNERRKASHILINVPADATDAQRTEAKDKAEAILAQLQINPDSFENVAVKESQDPGSAQKGGDLGFFGRGDMVPAFENAAFSMQEGQISDLVESEFGYHIIKLTGIEGESNDFDAIKPSIKGDLMFKKAQERFLTQAEEFNNMVYEQSGSLAPASEAFNLDIQTSEWLSQKEAMKFFNDNAQFASLLFTPEAIEERLNTEAVEVKPNTIVSARVVDYAASKPREYDNVKQAIEDLLKLEEASKLAILEGKGALKILQEGMKVDTLDWQSEVAVDRKNAEGLTDLAMRQVFKTNVDKLPAYSGVEDSRKGFLIVKVSDVQYPDPKDSDAAGVQSEELVSALNDEYLSAYKGSLRAEAKVKVNEALLLNQP